MLHDKAGEWICKDHSSPGKVYCTRYTVAKGFRRLEETNHTVIIDHWRVPLMSANRTITKTLFTSLSIILFLLVSTLGYFWIYEEYRRMMTETERIKEEQTEAKKQIIQTEVLRNINYVVFKRSQMQQRVRDDIMKRVYEAHIIAGRIYDLGRDTMPEDQIKRVVIETLRPIRFNKGRGYYFATDLTGVEQLFADRPEMEQKNLIEMQDTRGRYVIRDMIGIVRDQGEGFYEYTWTKPGEEDRDFPKIAFVKLFEPFNWFIGTGEYMDDVQSDIQQEALDRISRIRFGNDGYIFVMSSDGVLLSHPDAELIGKNIRNLADPNGILVGQELINASRHPGGDFVRYTWPKPTTGMQARKLSFAVSFQYWDWIIGTGVYLDDLEGAIAAEQKEYRRSVIRQILFILTLFISFIVISLLITRFIAGRLQDGIERFMSFFRKTATSYEKIDPDVLSFAEFKSIGGYANKLVDDFRTSQEELRSERDKAQSFLDTAGVMFVALDREGTITLINRKGCEILGYDESEILGKNWFDTCITDFDLEKVKKLFFAIISGDIEQHEYEEGVVVSRGGTKKIIAWHNAFLLDPDGRITGILSSGEDITKRRQAEVSMRESEQRYSQLFENAGDAIYVHDLEGRFIDANRIAYERLGYTREELLSMTVMDIDAPEYAVHVPERIGTLKKKEVIVFESVRLRKDGSPIPLEITSQMISISGKPAVLSIARDITERRQMEEQKRIYETSLLHSQKMEAIGTLAGGIAHDFNNILSAIIGYTELCLMEDSSVPRLRKYHTEILRAGERARDLVKQILTFSRHEEGEEKPVVLKYMVKEVLKLLRASLPATIEIRQNIRSEGMVMVDPTQIHQVIMNLCTNAAHAMETGGGVLSIEVDETEFDTETAIRLNARGPGHYMVLTVSDTGCGMTQDIVGRIFDPYFTTKEKDKGTGLGLAVVHGIVINNRGTTSVKSEPGRGTTFRIYLPRIVMVAGKDTVPVPVIPTGTERILFVDDEPALADLAQQMLESLGYAVTTTTDSLQALELFRSGPHLFDLVITDMTMPKMTGEKLAQELFKIRNDIPVILCTGYSGIMSAERSREIGIRDFALKPLLKKDLATKIRAVLDQH